MTINKLLICLCTIVILVLAINMSLMDEQIKTISNTVDEINIMLKDFNDG